MVYVRPQRVNTDASETPRAACASHHGSSARERAVVLPSSSTGLKRRGDPKDRLGKMDADHQNEILLHFRVAKRQRQIYIRNRLMAKTRLLSHLSRDSRTLNHFKFRRAVQHAELAYVVTY